MNELDDLRHALHSPPDFTPRALDLNAIMVSGGRLRTRRRIVASAATALSVVAVLIGGGLWAGHDRTAGSSTIAPADPGPPAPHPRSTAGANPTPDPAPAETDQPLGDVIATGMTTAAGEWVLYGIPVQESTLPKVHFGVMLGVRKAGRAPVAKVEINETGGSDRSPGFHEGEAAGNYDGLDAPAFGYFVGSAARITASVKGHLTTAHLAAWSEDPQVVFFWFDLKDVAAGVPVGQLTAYDRNGRKLAATKSGLGVG